MNPVQAIELLFFAIFGQTTHEQFKVATNHPQWTTILFKLAFGIYMLVSVVVLINLLIAMMSDTYQRIQAQSDIEWKYGLSKLIRNMQRTTTAPSPLNLLTSWMSYLYKLCKKRRAKKHRPSLVHMMGLRRGERMSARSKMGAKWLSKMKKSQVGHKDSIALSVVHLSPLGSQLSFSNANRIDSVVDWDAVRRKYRELVSVTQNPIQIIENLFFSIFGQKEVDDFSRSLKYGLQPSWTRNFYKVSFMLYMLVTVVVLMNLLIAMMSDTYAAIQAQSDIEWKFGLSKLVRNMQKATAAPPPLNLFTSWIFYLNKKIRKFCCNRNKIRAMPASMGYQSGRKRWSIKNNRMYSIRHKDSVTFAGFGITPLGSQAQIEYATRIDKVLDWEVVRKKYRMLFGDEMEKPSEVEMPDTTDDLDQRDQSNEVE